MQIGYGVAAFAAVRALDEVTITYQMQLPEYFTRKSKRRQANKRILFVAQPPQHHCHGDDLSHLVATPSVNPVQDPLRFQLEFHKTLCDFAVLPVTVHLDRHMSNMHKQLLTCT